MSDADTLTARAARRLEGHATAVLATILLISGLLIVPLLTMGTDQQASAEPGGEVFDLRDDVNRRFAPLYFGTFFIAEARAGGDVLAPGPLLELRENAERLRASALGQEYLASGYDADLEQPFVGVYTIADAVHDRLRFAHGTSLEAASAAEVKVALHEVLSDPRTWDLRNFLSVQATSSPVEVAGRMIDEWRAPAVGLVVVADNEKLGGGTTEITIGADDTVLRKEHFSRDVQALLRGEQRTYRLWGVAVDANLEGEDEGAASGIYIMLTVLAVLLVVGVSLRSYWAVALTGVGLGLLMVWLGGLTHLIGLRGGLVSDLIVPIAMISLGADFAIHALRRYREERASGDPPQAALRVAFTGVLAALVLAVLSDAFAFLANVASGVEAVIVLGLTAGIAIVSAFVVLGIGAPLAMMRLDCLLRTAPGRATPFPLPRHPLAKALVVVAAFAGAAAPPALGVIAIVAVSEPLGLALIGAALATTIALPAWLMWRRLPRGDRDHVGDAAGAEANAPRQSVPTAWPRVSSLVTSVARRRLVVLPLAATLTAAAAFFAVGLDATLDVKDFFDPDSDFVVGLDKLDEHIGDTGGEGAIVYIRGDLADPAALAAIETALTAMRANPYVARRRDGEIDLQTRTVLTLLRRVMATPFARDQVQTATGVALTDDDADGLPDDRDQIRATYDFIALHGVPLNPALNVYEPGEVRETLFHDASGREEDATVFVVSIPGTREQSVAAGARAALLADLRALDAPGTISFYGLTGSIFTREATLAASTRSLQIALPIAAAASALLLVVSMRSLSFGLVTVIPIGLVVAWLYGVMALAGFSLNFVTATIGAISIGVGIDYSIHMTVRFREELRRRPTALEALHYAAAGAGSALLASAASSIVGFAILGFAPMPMFSSFGILSAIMIFAAALAALLVLPSLLLLITPSRATAAAPAREDETPRDRERPCA